MSRARLVLVSEFYSIRFVLPNHPPSSRKPFRIVYAGLLGVAQNILELIERIDFKGMGAELHLFGGGNQALEIEDYVRTHDKGVFYHWLSAQGTDA